MKPQARLVWLMSAAALLAAACGGGDDDAPAPAPAYTQADATQIAKLGALTAATSELVSVPMIEFHAGFLATFSSAAGGTTSATSNCPGGGQIATTTTKAVERVGLGVGDSIAITYSACVSSPFSLSGGITLIAQTDMANLAAQDYSLGYRAQLGGLVLSINGVGFTHSGTIDVTSGVTAGNVFASALQVPSGATYEFASPTVRYAFGAASRIASQQSVTPSSATLVIAGPVRLSAAGTSVLYTMATPTTLSGPIIQGGISPTAGVLDTEDFEFDLATSTQFTGTGATVRADTNRDNTLDLTFSTTWDALLAP